jgi:hypothetical protein
VPGLFPAKVGHWSVCLLLTSSGAQRMRVSTKAHAASGIRISQLLTIAKLLDGREVEMRDAGSMTSPTLMLGHDEDAR